jgi:hypothetical protein
MIVLDTDKQQIDKFFDAITSVEGVLSEHATVGYVALMKDGHWRLYSARLRLDPWRSISVSTVLETEQVRAGLHPLASLNLSPRALIEQVMQAQSFAFKEGEVKLEAERESYSPYLVAHPSAPKPDEPLATLKLRGGERWEFLDKEKLSWKLKGETTPYESIAEVCAEFDAGEEASTFAIIASPAVKIAPDSKLLGDQATLKLLLTAGLDPSRARISYRIASADAVPARGSIAGANLSWSDRGNYLAASATLAVPRGSRIACVASYASDTHHEVLLEDLTTSTNPRRIAFETLHRGLEGLRADLLTIKPKDSDGRAFEIAVTHLLWLLGFTASHLGTSKHLEKGPDHFFECNGRLAVVECTIGQLQRDKTSKLHARAVVVRKALEAAGRQDVEVVPVFVTQLSREEAAHDVEELASKGIVAITSDELHSLLDQTRLNLQPEALLAKWISSTQQAASTTGLSASAWFTGKENF